MSDRTETGIILVYSYFMARFEDYIEDVITKKIVYHLFNDEVEFLGCVILSYLLALEITCLCFHDFIDKDLIDLVLPDVRRYIVVLIGTVWFGNAQFALILGYGDLVQGNISINRVYYVEGLNHNLFSVGQFFYADVERHTQAWFRDRNFSSSTSSYINLLSNKDVMIGLPKLKYVKDQLCSSCEVSKAKRSSFEDKGCSKFKKTAKFASYELMWSNASFPNDKRRQIMTTLALSPQLQNVSPLADTTVPSQQELDLLFGPLYDGFFNTGTSRVNKSSSPPDKAVQQDTQPIMNNPSSIEPTTPTNVNAEENNDNQAEDTQFNQDEFINPFCTPVRQITKSSSRNIDNSNMHTFYQ
ncbi:hypothetical protein Tco_1335337 [Tanacetum coccineum]